MRVYSAGEAIGPAWEHTKALMWGDRRKGRFLKLALVAIGAELGTSFSFNFSSFRHSDTDPVAASILVGMTAFLLVISLLFFVGYLYLGSRLQLAQFDILVLRNPLVAPAWNRHGRQTWRWAGLKVVIMIGALVVLLPLLIPAIPIFVAFGRALQPVTNHAPGHLPTLHWAPLLLASAELLAILLVAILLIRFVTSLVLPGVAMEDLRFGAAFQHGWQLFRSDMPAMLWFALLQPLFLLVAGLVIGFVIIAALFVLALPFGLAAYLIWHNTQGPGITAWFLLGLLALLAIVVVGVVWFCLYLAATGTLLMFARAWTLYFLGGRYPLLGQYLEPSPAIPAWTPPPPMPRDDDGGSGGDFPMNPALA